MIQTTIQPLFFSALYMYMHSFKKSSCNHSKLLQELFYGSKIVTVVFSPRVLAALIVPL